MNGKKGWLNVLFFLCINIQSQCPYTLKGKITDLHEGKEITEAMVFIYPDSISVISDEHGFFQFSPLCAGNKRILIRHINCPDTLINFVLYKNDFIRIRINHYYHSLEEINIQEKLPDYRMQENAFLLDSRKLDEQRGGTYAEMLQKVPGVSLLQTGPSIARPMIHGMHGYRVLIVNNGVRHEAQQWGSEHAPEIDPFVYEKMEVVRGSGTLRYGSDAIGGVIASTTRPLPDTTGILCEVFSVGQSNGKSGNISGSCEGKFPFLRNLSFRVQGSLKNAGDKHAPTYFISNSGLREWNTSYEIGFDKKNTSLRIFYTQYNSRIGIFTGSHIGNLTDLQNILNGTSSVQTHPVFSREILRPFQSIIHEMIQFRWKQGMGKYFLVQTAYAFQYNARGEFDKHRPLGSSKSNTKDTPELDYRVQTQTAECVVEHRPFRKFRGQAGLQFLHQVNNSFGRFFIPNYLRADYGLFLTETFSLPHWILEGGVRYDYRYLASYYYIQNQLKSPVRIFDQFSTQWNLAYVPSSFLKFLVQAGNAWRSPGPNELYSNGLHHGVGGFEKGNSDLNKEISLNGNAAVQVQHSRLQIEIGYFIHHFRNFIYLQPTGQLVLTISGAFPEFEYRQSPVQIQGAEGSYRLLIFPWMSFSQNFMLLRAHHLPDRKYLIYMPADRIFSSLRLSGKIRKHEYWIQWDHTWIDKQYRVPGNEDFAPPPPGYHIWDIQAGMNIHPKPQCPPVMMIFEIKNLMNTSYRDYLDRFRYFTDAPGRNFILKIKIPVFFAFKRKK